MQKQAWRKDPERQWLVKALRATDSLLVSLRQAGLYEKAKELEDLVAFERARLRMMKGEITAEEALTLSPRGRELLLRSRRLQVAGSGTRPRMICR